MRDLARRLVLCRTEYAYNALLNWASPFAIASTSGLRDLVEARLRPPNSREIEINPGLDEGGRNQPAWLSASQALADVGQDAPTVRCVLSSGQMDNAIEGCGGFSIEGKRMRAAVDDEEALWLRGERSHEVVISLVAERNVSTTMRRLVR